MSLMSPAKANAFRLSSVEDLANLLGVDTPKLFNVVQALPQFYHREEKIKSDRKIRVLHIPHGELKEIQSLIQRRLLAHLPVHDAIHSYRKGRSALTAARLHENKASLIKLDIKEHFPSVKQEMVFQVFLKAGCSGTVARLLTKLTSYKNQLPQGAPTSNNLANLVMEPIAKRVAGIASKHRFAPSVYGDDISLSGPQRVSKFKPLLEEILRDENFQVSDNPAKNSTLTQKDRMTVLGYVVNRKVNTPREDNRNLRAIIHACRVKGPATQFGVNLQRAKAQLRGKVDRVRKVNPAVGNKLLQEFNLIRWD